MPTYETKADKENEASFAEYLKSKGFTVSQMKQHYPVDFFVKAKDGTPYLIEYKRRHHSFGFYKTAIIPLIKFNEFLSLARSAYAEPIYWLEYDDGHYYANLSKVGWCDVGPIERGERHGSNELCIFINNEYFKKG